jgi:hypothetical protein
MVEQLYACLARMRVGLSKYIPNERDAANLTGSLYRLERFMAKVLRGDSVTISVVGGSGMSSLSSWPRPYH